MIRQVVPAFAIDLNAAHSIPSCLSCRIPKVGCCTPCRAKLVSMQGENSHLVVVRDGLAGRGKVVVCDVLQLASIVVVVCMTAQHIRRRVYDSILELSITLIVKTTHSVNTYHLLSILKLTNI